MAKEISIPVTVRFRDLDALGHANYAVYLTYMEEAANELWAAILGSKDKLNAAEVGYVNVRAEIDYRSPAEFGEVLNVTIWVIAIGRSSFTTQYRVKEARSGRIIADAKTVNVVMLPGTEKGKMPENIRSGLQEYLSDAG